MRNLHLPLPVLLVLASAAIFSTLDATPCLCPCFCNGLL
uniref:Uncharacterized protein n=1 Tax=Picea glauca TaxID=3330 RepID=A0A101M4M5_PICGL|nr:hypothetical protein ABT39_MTgene766 [Picea glauca]QHR90484.1 hypothetical protein Q903MT_gene4508 [Picea sitchensis]